MADLFKSLKPDANIAKNGFDLSRKHVFSSNAGQLIPALSLETVPGDHFEIDLAALSRTMTFNTAAFLRGKQRFDFFFVPYTQLWHPFNQFITQRNDSHSTRQLQHTYCPVVRLSAFLNFIYASYKYQKIDFFYQSIADNAIKLLDILGYGNFTWVLEVTDDDEFQDLVAPYANISVNLFRLAAYQHIWYDYYRNKFYDTGVTGGLNSSTFEGISKDSYVSSFNYDDIICGTFSNSLVFTDFSSAEGWYNIYTVDGHELDGDSAERLYLLLNLHYCQWKKDIFTTALPSQQFGVVSSVDISGVNILNDTPISGASYNSALVGQSGSATPNMLFNHLSANNSWSIPSAFDVLSLRKAEALQAWKQNTLRAGNMTDDSFKAHYGVEPYYEGDENVHYLGSFSAALQVNAVEATAVAQQGVNRAVGDLAATGTIVTNGNKIKFDARDFGIIMCVASFLPESEYMSNALDKANKLYEQFDFYTPEFQNIGLEAVPVNESNYPIDEGRFNHVLGYAPRYYMYKSAVDRVFGNFGDSYNMEPASGNEQSVSASLGAWVSPRMERATSEQGGSVVRNLASFYVDPRIYNDVFGVNANYADQFLHNVYFDIKAIRPMSVLGLPQF